MRGRKDSLWFSFKGVRSDAMGVHVVALPDIPVAEERGEEVVIPGRDGSLWIAEGAYADVSLPFTIDIDRTADINAITAWLSGRGELVLSSQSGYCYRVRITSGYALHHGVYAYGMYRTDIEFIGNPYRYEIGNPALPDITTASQIAGHGTAYSRPIITIYGNGDVNLMINEGSVLIEGIVDYVTLDCDAMMAYKGDENWCSKVTLLSNFDVDEWPSLRPEGQSNWLDWSDEAPSEDDEIETVTRNNVTKIVLQPNWRWR